MKKILCIVLALCLGMCAFAESVTDEMTALTLKVKQTLLIDDNYDRFTSSSYDGVYNLYWYSDSRAVNVSVKNDGTIYSYWYNGPDSYEYTPGFNARFPVLGADETKAAAVEFLSRVITGEGRGYTEPEIGGSLSLSGDPLVYLHGYLTLYGIPTDISWTVGVNSGNGNVESYSLGYMYRQLSEPGKAEAVVDAQTAEALLKAHNALKAVYYVTDENEPARLVYIKSDSNIRFVRADNGEIIGYNDEASDNGIYYKETADSFATAARGETVKLTEYEAEGISKYDGAKSVAELEAILRSISALGITDSYELKNSRYYLDDETPCANLSFENGSIYRSINLSALDGSIRYIDSWNTSDSFSVNLPVNTGRYAGFAFDFMKGYFPDYAAQVTLTNQRKGMSLSRTSSTCVYTFTRTCDGYLYEDNTVIVTVNPSDKSICGLWINWNDGLEFASAPETLIGEDAAKEAFCADARPELMYASIYNKATQAFDLTLVWRMVGGEKIYAVDAETGAPYTYTESEKDVFTYDDTSDMPYPDETVKLGQYGVGAAGCTFTKGETATREVLMELVLRAEGYTEFSDLAGIFNGRYGTIPAEDPTLAEMCRVMVKLAGYESAAKLTGIYTAPIKGFDELPDELKGCCAIAYALGMVNEGADLTAPLMSADAAHAVYALLDR